MITWEKKLAEKWLGPLPDSKHETYGQTLKKLSDKVAISRSDFINRLNTAIEINRNSDKLTKVSGMLRVDIIDGKRIGFEGAKYRGKFLRKEFRDYYDSLSEEDKKPKKKRLKHRNVLEDKASVLNYLEGLKNKFKTGVLEDEFNAIDKIRDEKTKS